MWWGLYHRQSPRQFRCALVTTTIIFSVALAAIFVGWYASEKTLSIHSIYTTRRERWYWLTILFTFALGTAAGDLSAERLGVGYWRSALLFAGVIALVAVAHFALKARLDDAHRRQASNAVLAFWIAYILTRPLGASLGDYLSQSPSVGGLGLGTVVTSAIFLAAIAVLVIYLTVTRKDEIPPVPAADETRSEAPA